MEVIKTTIPGVLHIRPKVWGDARGYFLETWQKERYQQMGVNVDFVQDNTSYSRRGVLRGLHLQNPGPQGKLVYAQMGEVFDVAVDVRVDSPYFGQHVAVVLKASEGNQLYIPPGFAHGFVVLSETALFAYKCTQIYNPPAEVTVRWDDPALGIPWPEVAGGFSLNDRDRNAPCLSALDPSRLVPFSKA